MITSTFVSKALGIITVSVHCRHTYVIPLVMLHGISFGRWFGMRKRWMSLSGRATGNMQSLESFESWETQSSRTAPARKRIAALVDQPNSHHDLHQEGYQFHQHHPCPEITRVDICKYLEKFKPSGPLSPISRSSCGALKNSSLRVWALPNIP